MIRHLMIAAVIACAAAPAIAADQTERQDAAVEAAPSTIPEPAAWVMMLAGFGLVAVAARRRRKIVTA